MKGRVISLLLIILGIWACEADVFDPGFTGITETDETGIILKSDTNDWQFSDSWNRQEQSLFDMGFSMDCSLENYFYQVTAYPNPCVDTCRFYIDMPTLDHCFVYRIVDDQFNLLLSGETNCSSLVINIKEIKKSSEVVRMYYKILNHTCELRGHGDILINIGEYYISSAFRKFYGTVLYRKVFVKNRSISDGTLETYCQYSPVNIRNTYKTKFLIFEACQTDS